MQNDLRQLNARVKALEAKFEQGPSTSATLPVDKNKSAVIKMILQDKAGGRRIALQKLLTVMFGASTLAYHVLLVGKNSKNPSLDPAKLNIIKGMQCT